MYSSVQVSFVIIFLLFNVLEICKCVNGEIYYEVQQDAYLRSHVHYVRKKKQNIKPIEVDKAVRARLKDQIRLAMIETFKINMTRWIPTRLQTKEWHAARFN